MSILENLYWGRNRAHVRDFFGYWPLVSSDLNFFHGITADHKSSCCKEILADS